MKQCYPRVPLFTALFTLIFYLPHPLKAQCLCSDGSPALTELHTGTLTFPSNTTTMLNVPQFSPSTGTLVCVNAKIFLTSVLRMKLENDDIRPISYEVNYARMDTFSGPGISTPVTGARNIGYGPYYLEPSDNNPFNGLDYIGIGPDTVYNKVLYETTTSDISDYIGPGTVDFTYRSIVNTYAIGSDYYALAVNSQNKVDFAITYSYCNDALLSLNLKNFQAKLKDRNNVVLSWITQNENQNNVYEIQLSENGAQFNTIGTTSSSQPFDGTSAKYEYQHRINQPVNGKLYYRIKQFDGKTAKYSEIRTVNLGTDAFPGLRIYPNPVVRNINMEFDQPLNGSFQVELSNEVGQIVYTRTIRLNNNTAVQLTLNNPPPPGIYYLRARDSGSKKVYSGKLLFSK